jgi:hypothetical protein
MVFILSASTFAATASNKPENLPKTENKLSEEEAIRLTRRVEEIRDMDKTDMAAKEKRELRKEVKIINKSVRDGGVIYIGTGTLLIIILLIILL